jgi:homoserine dehydrogenase
MKRVPVIILGCGGVGQALLAQIVKARARVALRAECRFDVIAVADSRSWLWDREGLADEQLLGLIASKRKGLTLAPGRGTDVSSPGERPVPGELVEQANAEGLPGVILADVTAAEGMEFLIDRALQLGYSVALANKKALAGPWTTAQSYFNHRRVRHESTVGGGQPVVATLRYLLDVNDPVYEIQGQLSGTLGFICTRLDEGIPLSQAIAEARDSGFTEPDPREDLGGKDVMRKVIILGRMAGWPLEERDIAVESLFPAQMADMSVADFMRHSTALDAAMDARFEAAAANGCVLRYVAELQESGGSVGLKMLPANSPLSALKYVSFRTAYYDDEPLLIGGKGAGVEMTAAGVLGDMISLAREIAE